MKIVERIKKALKNNEIITMAFLGDSVTMGCFGWNINSQGKLEGTRDMQCAYCEKVKEILNLLYPTLKINIVNAGISGDNATKGYMRVDEDVISKAPDFVVVSYGLNDSCCSSIDEYLDSLTIIFSKLKENNIEFVFLTQNAMCTRASDFIKEQKLEYLSNDISKAQNSGRLKLYFEKAKELCKEYGGGVCDLYPVWEKMLENDVDVTEFLSNKLNHPPKEYHYYIAIKIIETIFGI